ncbi:MAG: nitroreductase family protein [Pseudomonadota bacterium]
MRTLSNMGLGLIGQLKPKPAMGDAPSMTYLPSANTTGGIPLMQALAQRRSLREFDPAPLPLQMLSDLLWAAAGINRAALAGHTAPSAMNAHEVSVYAALPTGLYLYGALTQSLSLVSATDVRRVTGYQDLVDTAPLELVFVADSSRLSLLPAAQRTSCAWAAAGAMAQNVSLYCASAGLSTVVRAWFDHEALTQSMGLTRNQQVLLSQTVGRPRVASKP